MVTHEKATATWWVRTPAFPEVAYHCKDAGNRPDTRIAESKTKNANLHGLAFCSTLFLVARGGIETPTQGFSRIA